MTDIIKDAKQLLDGSTPAPWEWVGYSIESERGMVLDFQCVTEFGLSGASRAVEVTPEDEQLIAAVPKMAQALAEETYEYTAQVHMYNRSWVFMWSPTSGNSIYGKWHPTRELAEKFAEQWQLDYPTRLVRRRVSPVEESNG